MLSISMAVLTAVIADYYTNVESAGWMVLTAFLTTQTTEGTPLRQGIIFYFIITLAMIFASLLVMLAPPLVVYVIVGIIFVASAFAVFFSWPLSNKQIFHLMLFAFVLMIACLRLAEMQTPISDKLIAIMIGAMLGILFNQFFFPIKLNKAFFQGILPSLKALQEFSYALTDSFQGENNHDLLAVKKIALEKSMLFQYSRYPSWVYETGFNPGLRSSWRYFLVNLERVVEIYFALDLLAMRSVDVSLLGAQIALVMKKNEALLDMLLQYVNQQKIADIDADFSQDLAELENAFKQVVPNQIEFLDVSPNAIILATVVRDMRDLRGLLLQLVMALPAGSLT